VGLCVFLALQDILLGNTPGQTVRSNKLRSIEINAESLVTYGNIRSVG
jgi:hypothetical protein